MTLGLRQKQELWVTVISMTVSIMSVTASVVLWYNHHAERKERIRIVSKLEKKRQDERTGRIRAEVKLREALAKLEISNSLIVGPISDDEMYNDVIPHSIIGTIVSPFPKRMGTPRQGALVPSSRGYIQFSPSLAPECLAGIEDYSHLWVIFRFHENTSLSTSKKTKIRPPRGGGIKVGQLSTRSPHRPNNLGLSLVTLYRWEPSTRRLYIRALDLVDKTPVFDVKPFVPWDIPMEVSYDVSRLRVPQWVESKDDVLPSVMFDPIAEKSLENLVRQDLLSPMLYPANDPSSFGAAKHTLMEILAQDPRSSHRGLTKNQRGTLSSNSSKTDGMAEVDGNDAMYRLLFGNATIEFVVEEGGAVVKSVVHRDC